MLTISFDTQPNDSSYCFIGKVRMMSEWFPCMYIAYVHLDERNICPKECITYCDGCMGVCTYLEISDYQQIAKKGKTTHQD
jgi:hypothetical protein